MHIRRARPDEADLLFEIWRSAVEATHHFLTAADFKTISAMVRDEYLPSAALWVATDDEDRPLAFIGMTNDMVDTLFVAPSAHGRGIGHALMAYARTRAGPLRVDVNEQNEAALVFYQRLGFRVAGRSECDAAGMPYPLLHLVEG
jgi:putative acetyltransferase